MTSIAPISTADSQPLLFGGGALGASWPWRDLTLHGYDLLMIDPPWHFELFSDEGEAKSAQAQYRTMPLDEIKDLPVRLLAKPNCLVWLWATFPLLPDALQVLDAWGCRYITGGAWHKTTRHGKTAFGTGYVLRSACEPFLIGKFGDPPTTRSTRNIVVGAVREHSAKPEEAYAAAEALMPGAHRAEIFSRRTRPGWDVWGDESGKLDVNKLKENAA